MLNTQEKVFFATIARNAGELSGCDPKDGAVLIKSRRILSYGFNKRIVPAKDWAISAIYDTLFGSRDIDFSGADLFTTRFPTTEELKLIAASGIATVYFTGPIDHIEDLQFASNLFEAGIPLEIIKLE